MSDKTAGRGLTVPKNPAAMLRALNTRHATEDIDTNQPTDLQTNNTTILQTDNSEDRKSASGEVDGHVPSSAVDILTADRPESTGAILPTTIQSDKPTNKTTDTKTNRQTSQPTKKQTNNTTKIEPVTVPMRRDGRTLRTRLAVADQTATIVTSFRISVATMEALDRYCFENRVRKQDVVEQALAAFMDVAAGDEE